MVVCARCLFSPITDHFLASLLQISNRHGESVMLSLISWTATVFFSILQLSPAILFVICIYILSDYLANLENCDEKSCAKVFDCDFVKSDFNNNFCSDDNNNNCIDSCKNLNFETDEIPTRDTDMAAGMSDFDPFSSLDSELEPKKNSKVQFRQPPSTPVLKESHVTDWLTEHSPSTPVHQPVLLQQPNLDFQNEDFKPAAEIFNSTAAWEILENFGSSKKKTTQDLTRESLYVRFDPLVRKKSPKPALVIKEENEDVDENGKSPKESAEEDLLMMCTPPLKDRKAAKRRLNTTVQNELDRMFCDFEPPAHGDSPPTLDSAPTSLSNVEDGIVEVLKYSEADMQKVLVDHQARILAKERDFEQREHEAQKKLKEAVEDSLRMKQANEDMQKLITEYERTVSQVISDKTKLTMTKEGSLAEAMKERDQAYEQLRTMETAFSDLYGRYEKTKGAVGTLKTNEEELKKCVSTYQQKIKKHEQRYEVLKQHAQDKLNSANVEIDRVTKTKNSEIAKVQAALKKAEISNKSLQQSLDQKMKENEELTSICDDLIKQVGGDP